MKTVIIIVFLCFFILWRIKKLPKQRGSLLKILEITDFSPGDKIIEVEWKDKLFDNIERFIVKGPKFKQFYSLHNGNRCDRRIERILRREFVLIRGEEESYSSN